MPSEYTTDVVDRQTTPAIFGHRGVVKSCLANMTSKVRTLWPQFPFAQRLSQARVAAGFTMAELDKELALRKGWIKRRDQRAPQRIWAMEERGQENSKMRGQKYNEHAPAIADIIKERIPTFNRQWLLEERGDSGLDGKALEQSAPTQKKNVQPLKITDKQFLEVQEAWNHTTKEVQNALYLLATNAPRLKRETKRKRTTAGKGTQGAVSRTTAHTAKDRHATGVHRRSNRRGGR